MQSGSVMIRSGSTREQQGSGCGASARGSATGGATASPTRCPWPASAGEGTTSSWCADAADDAAGGGQAPASERARRPGRAGAAGPGAAWDQRPVCERDGGRGVSAQRVRAAGVRRSTVRQAGQTALAAGSGVSVAEGDGLPDGEIHDRRAAAAVVPCAGGAPVPRDRAQPERGRAAVTPSGAAADPIESEAGRRRSSWTRRTGRRTADRPGSTWATASGRCLTTWRRPAYEWAVDHGDRYRIAYAMPRGRLPGPGRVGLRGARLQRTP